MCSLSVTHDHTLSLILLCVLSGLEWKTCVGQWQSIECVLLVEMVLLWDSDRRVTVNNIQVMLVCGRPGDRGGGTETAAASRHQMCVNRMCSLGRNGSLMDAPDCTWHRKMHRHPRGTTARLKKKNAGEFMRSTLDRICYMMCPVWRHEPAFHFFFQMNLH